MPRTKPTTRKAPSKPGGGLPLSIPLPGGGTAIFYAEHELTPRRTRSLEVRMTALSPLIARVGRAAQITSPGGEVDVREVLDGEPLALTEEQAEQLTELNDMAAWAYLKSWTLDRPLPATPDDLLDVPTPVYRALVEHAAKLLMANRFEESFTVDALPDDLDEVDEDLPTSA